MAESEPFDDWWAVVFSVLEARANDGSEPDEEEVERAILSLAAVTMVGVGMDPAFVDERLTEGGYETHLAYDVETDQVQVTLEWPEGDDFVFGAGPVGVVG